MTNHTKTTKLRSIEKTEYVPDELIRQILSHAPVKSLIQLKRVSKTWHTIINDPTFINLHLNQAIQHNNFSLLLYNSNHIYSIHDPTSAATTECPSVPFNHEHRDYYDVAGSCDGLILLIPYRGCFGIWNPSTGEFISIPSPYCSENYILTMPWHENMYGFGYGSNRSDYKIVSIFGTGNVKVFSTQSGSRMWKTIEGSNIHVVFDDSLYIYNSNGIFARGAVHWLMCFFVTPTEEEDRIIAYDFGCEEFRTIPMPDRLTNNKEYKRLSKWGESICLFIKDCREWSSHIFVMKEYGVRDSWSKLYTIPEAPIPLIPEAPCTNPRRQCWSLVCFIEDEKILLTGVYSIEILIDFWLLLFPKKV
ncbi:hypothetical protein Syun_006525 [Stephania yunnanensis]|uniref:F-box domain-containing protein n=1 Tax=Stephania yunnanensis TaxID=152371 RepID=A0AAP0L061_9MAGN